jgi:hypothetical protein
MLGPVVAFPQLFAFAGANARMTVETDGSSPRAFPIFDNAASALRRKRRPIMLFFHLHERVDDDAECGEVRIAASCRREGGTSGLRGKSIPPQPKENGITSSMVTR